MTEENPYSWMFYKGKEISFPVPKDVRTPMYVIGDSHVLILHEAFPQVFRASNADIANVFESKSAHAIGSKGHDLYLNEAVMRIPDGSVVILSFGEIDCRHYVPKLAKEQGRSIESMVDEVIARYSENCIRLLKEKFRLVILGPYVCPDDHGHTNSFTDILSAKLYMNTKLEQLCQDHEMAFVPLLKKVLDQDWDRKPQGTYFNDLSHLGPCMIPVIFEAVKDFKWRGFDV